MHLDIDLSVSCKIIVFSMLNIENLMMNLLKINIDILSCRNFQ